MYTREMPNFRNPVRGFREELVQVDGAWGESGVGGQDWEGFGPEELGGLEDGEAGMSVGVVSDVLAGKVADGPGGGEVDVVEQVCVDLVAEFEGEGEEGCWRGWCCC